MLKKVPGASRPLSVPKLIINEGPANVAIKYGFHGPCYALVTACTSGTDAIGAAFNAIRHGQIDARCYRWYGSGNYSLWYSRFS